MTQALSPRHRRSLSKPDGLPIECFREHPDGTHLAAPIDPYLGRRNVPQPDLVGVVGNWRGRVSETGIEGAPDLCIEILSPPAAGLDCGKKRASCRRAGVKEFWVVKPESETVASCAPVGSKKPRAISGNENLASPLLPGFSARPRDVFAS